jgi:spermidine/putrescine-binding protein
MKSGVKSVARTMLLIAGVVIVGVILYFTIRPSNNAPRTDPAPDQSKTRPTPGPDGENTLRLMAWEGHAPRQHVEKFEKQIEAKYGRKVKLDIKYAFGTDAFYDAIRAKEIDLVIMTHHYYKDERFKYIENKLLLPLNLENIPNYKYVTPALQKAKQLHSNGKIYASPVSQGPYGLAYNTALLKEEPQSWDILWNPGFKGKYVIGANEYTYNASITALALGYAREDISNYDKLNNKEFKDKLRQLAVNAHSFWIGVDKPDDLSGMPLATSWGDSLGLLNRRGEPWKMAEPAEGMPCWFESYAITWALADKPFLKKVAEEYINGVLSTDYQVNHITRYMSLTPVITNIGDLLTPEEKKRLHIGIPNFFKNNRILMPTCSRRDRNGLKLLWKEAMKGIQIKKGSK